MQTPTHRFMGILSINPGERGQILEADKTGWFPKFVDVPQSETPRIAMPNNPNMLKENEK